MQRVAAAQQVTSADDLLGGASWTCTPTPPGQVEEPGGLAGAGLGWLAAQVPGTAASALGAAGRWALGDHDEELLDGSDWWFRTTVEVDAGGPAVLECEGLATIADVWVDGELVLRAANMWRAHRAAVDLVPGPREVVIRCAALAPVLRSRRPRPRWRSKLIRHQNLRWVRTALIGRIDGWAWSGAPVGPWRPVHLWRGPRLVDPQVRATLEGSTGVVELRASVDGLADGLADGLELTVEVGGVAAPMRPDAATGGWAARVELPAAGVWWPHTHGEPVLHPLTVLAGGSTLWRTAVGFRTVEVDRADDGFAVRVNGTPVFCRGYLWSHPDVVSLTATREELRRSLQLVVESGANMVRVGGYTHYQAEEFWELCDELGIMVWQDCMLASFEPPDDPDWIEELGSELRHVFGALGGHPSLAVTAGSSETYQQASMYGLPPGSCTSVVLEEHVPAVLGELLPHIPYVPSAPSGGVPAFRADAGVAHYFGVGGFLRPISDVRSAGVRFAGECLAFANPPDPEVVDRFFGSAHAAGHLPSWKMGVARDPGTSWDFEDVGSHYVRLLFGVDPLAVRMADPERALDLHRAAACELMAATFGEWRRDASPCAGGLVLTWQDLAPGAGWGLLDVTGRPKAPWHALRRRWATRAVWLTDEGLAGLDLHVANDLREPLEATVGLTTMTGDGRVVDEGELAVVVPGRSTRAVADAEVIGGYRDLTVAARFGPPAHDLVIATLIGPDGTLLGRDTYVPPHVRRAEPGDLGLRGELHRTERGWEVVVSAERVAHWAALDVEGWQVTDNWFTVAPGRPVAVGLVADACAGIGADGDRPPRGRVRAINSRHASTLQLSEGER